MSAMEYYSIKTDSIRYYLLLKSTALNVRNQNYAQTEGPRQNVSPAKKMAPWVLY